MRTRRSKKNGIHSLYFQDNHHRQGTDYFKEILCRLDGLTDMTIYGDTSYIKNGIFISKPVQELSTDCSQLRSLFNKAFDFGLITSSYANKMLKPQLVNTTRLISFLKKEYNIEIE